jgi:hypothetical protein
VIDGGDTPTILAACFSKLRGSTLKPSRGRPAMRMNRTLIAAGTRSSLLSDRHNARRREFDELLAVEFASREAGLSGRQVAGRKSAWMRVDGANEYGLVLGGAFIMGIQCAAPNADWEIGTPQRVDEVAVFDGRSPHPVMCAMGRGASKSRGRPAPQPLHHRNGTPRSDPKTATASTSTAMMLFPREHLMVRPVPIRCAACQASIVRWHLRPASSQTSITFTLPVAWAYTPPTILSSPDAAMW